MRYISQFIPVISWLPKYKASDIRGDVTAGLTVAVMIIPQAIAYGLLAGVTPEVALYASI
ncbi:MAG: SulP family sulfate permease, partial [Kiritimatiellia bacterium]